MPADSQAFLKEWKDQMIDGGSFILHKDYAQLPPGIVEQVRDGSTVRVRLLLSEDLHQIVNVSLAGVRSPRIGGKDGETTEPFGEEV